MSDSTHTDFSALPLSTELRNNLKDLGFSQLTQIQADALPPMLAGKDVIGQAKTGSGKTVAFGLGILNKLDVKRFRIQSLVLCPTRELADQVARELRKLARATHNVKILTLCGGVPMGPQIGSLEHGAHIIVGTPGRIEDHLGRGGLDLSHVNLLVLDEADRMLEMGFQDSLDFIISKISSPRQTLLFSATYPDSIQQLAGRIQQQPVMVKVEDNVVNSNIRQHFYEVADDAQRLQALNDLLLAEAPESALIFCNTKKETDEAADYLRGQGFAALALHGDMEQRDRDQTLVCFASKSARVLVATDVAARGLDIDKLELVINYHLARDAEVHVHRVGRTGRAGNEGLAISLVSHKEGHKFTRLQNELGITKETEALPEMATGHLRPPKAAMVTLQIDGGKKDKIRPGDIVGALTSGGKIQGDEIGKIQVMPMSAYVAVQRKLANQALELLNQGKVKGRKMRARIIGV